MAPSIPDRWLSYKPVGKRIEETRFIAFKVPLREHVLKEINEDNRLDTDDLLQNIPNLGLIIDLTNTNRYYDPEFFRKAGVEHKKLMIPGHITPPEHLVNKFKLYVLSFLNENKNNDKLIGVHCTHGVNRTGYLICHFMISELKFNPNEAIQRFDAARGHQIERSNYLRALQELASTKKISSDYINSNNRHSYERRPERKDDITHRINNSGKIHKPTHANDRHRPLEKYIRVEDHKRHTSSNNYSYPQNHTQSDYKQQSMQQNLYTQHSYEQHSQRNERNNSSSQNHNFRDHNQRSIQQNHYIQPSHSYRQYNQTVSAENYGAYRSRQHGSTPYSKDNRPNRFGSERDNANKRNYSNDAPNYRSNNERTNRYIRDKTGHKY